MASIQETKKRKIAVHNIHKITKAMELVSIAKSKRLNNKIDGVRTFKNGIYEIIESIVDNKDIKESTLFQKRSSTNKTLWIVITSDMGLCGSYNSNVMKMVVPLINSKKDFIIVKGLKGVSNLKHRVNKIADIKYERYSENEFEMLSREITKNILELFSTEKVDEVKIAWTQYHNQITFSPIITDLLPLDKNYFRGTETTKPKHTANQEIYFEPNIINVLKEIIPLYLNSTLLSIITESTLSEYSARRVAMENATNNGEELMEMLEIEYNKARQQKITQELTEIIAGAESEQGDKHE